MNKIIDLMTGRECVRMDQLPVEANGQNSRRYALALAGAALFLGAVGPGVVAPRTEPYIAIEVPVPSPRIS